MSIKVLSESGYVKILAAVLYVFPFSETNFSDSPCLELLSFVYTKVG